MRRFVVFLFVCVGTVSAMDHATDYALHYGMRDIAACFRQGLYRQAVGDAIKATKENVDNALASSCKLFLKEFYPLLLEEDATLIDFNDEIGNLLRGFVPERECSNYYRWMYGLCGMAKEKYGLCGMAKEKYEIAKHWQEKYEAVRQIFIPKGEVCVIGLGELFASVPDAVSDAEASSEDIRIQGTTPLDRVYAQAEIFFEGTLLSEKTNPFECVIASFEKGDYRKSVMQAIWIAKNVREKENKNDAKLFLREFFDFLLEHENDTSKSESPEGLLSFKDLICFREDVDSLLNGSDPAEDNLGTMFVFYDLVKAKQQNTGKEYWSTVPSVRFDHDGDVSAESVESEDADPSDYGE